MKKSLMIIPGWAYPYAFLMGLARHLSETFDVIEPSSSFAQEAQYLDRVSQLRQPVILVGWSMGGLIALEAARRYPEIISGLALLASTARFCSDTDYSCGVPPAEIRALTLALKKQPELTMAHFYARAAGEGRNPSTPTPQPSQNKPSNELMDGLKYLQTADKRSFLKELNTPALIIHGKKDKVIPWQASEFLSEHMANNRLLIWDSAEHLFPAVQAAETAEAIRIFFQSQHSE